MRRIQITRKQNHDFSSTNLFQVLGDEIGNQDLMEDDIDQKQVQEISQEKLRKSTLRSKSKQKKLKVVYKCLNF